MPRVPIQTGKTTFVDSLGNTESVTKYSLLGPLPTESNDESRCGPRFQPIRFWNDSRFAVPRQMQKPATGYVGNPVDDPEYLAKHFPSTPNGIDTEEWGKKWRGR